MRLLLQVLGAPSGWVQFGILISFSLFFGLKYRISSVGSCNGHCGHEVVFSLRRTGFEVALFFYEFLRFIGEILMIGSF